jgi:hypothetical protein
MAADGSSNLEIIISAVDEASAAIQEVNASFESMSEAADAASSATDASLESVGLTMSNVTGEIEDSMLSQQQSFDLLAEVMQTDSAEIQQLILDEGISFQEAAAVVEEANAEIAASTDETASAIDLTKGSFTSIGVAAGIAFAAVSSAVASAISSAQEWNIESATIAGELKQIGSSIPLSEVQAYAQQVQSATLITQQQALQSEGLILSFKQLAPSYQSLTMLSADLATKMSQTSGSLSDNMPNATKILTEALANPIEGFSQLTRQANVNIPAAMMTTIENMAKVGNTAGADTLIIKALTEQVGGLAEAAAKAPGAGITQLQNQLTATGMTIGQALLPDLDALAKALIPIIQDIGDWVQEHPKLTEAILASVVAFTALLAVLTVVGIIVAALASSFVAFGVGMAAVIALLVGVVVANWTLIKTDTEETWNFILDFLKGVWALLTAEIENSVLPWVELFQDTWSAVSMFTQTTWNVLKEFFTVTWDWLKDLFTSSLDFLTQAWTSAWQGLSDFLSNIWTTIKNTVKTGFDDIISAINGFINALDAIHISIPSIAIPGTKLATPSLNLGFSIPNVPMLADGGFVTQPTLAIIGEAGPEAVMPLSQLGSAASGNATQIVININGGVFPADASTIRQIGNQLATSIVQNLRVKNYAL